MTTATDRFNGLVGSVAIKAPVKVATTANITLSKLQTIDGVTVIAYDRVLVKDQTDATKNGIYLASSSDWQRAPDFNGAYDIVRGTQIFITSGTVNGTKNYALNTDNPVIDTSELSFIEFGSETGTSFNIISTGSTTARTIQDRWSDVRNVRDYGAVLNGVTDDTAAIQAAIDEGPGAVFIPNGIAQVSGLDVSGSNVRIFGNGSQSRLSLIGGSNRSIIRTVPGASQVFNFRCHDLYLEGNKSLQTGGTDVHGVELYGSLNSRVFNNEIYNCYEDGVYMYGANASISCLDSWIYNNKIFDVNRIGIEFGTFAGTLACYGNLIGPVNDLASSLYGIRISNVDTRVWGNHIFAARDANIIIDRTFNAQVFGNHCESAREHGLIINGAKQCIVTSNTVVKSGRSNSPATPNTYSGIYIQKTNGSGAACNDIVVANNSCHSEEVTESGILLQKYGIEIASDDAIDSGIIAYNHVGGNATGGINKAFLEGVEIIGNIPLGDYFSEEVQFYDFNANADLTKTLTITVDATSTSYQGVVGMFEIELGYNDYTGLTEGFFASYLLTITKRTSGLFYTVVSKIGGTATEPTYTLTRGTNTSSTVILNFAINGERGIFMRSKQKELNISPRSFYQFTQSIT